MARTTVGNQGTDDPGITNGAMKWVSDRKSKTEVTVSLHRAHRTQKYCLGQCHRATETTLKKDFVHGEGC